MRSRQVTATRPFTSVAVDQSFVVRHRRASAAGQRPTALNISAPVTGASDFSAGRIEQAGRSERVPGEVMRSRQVTATRPFTPVAVWLSSVVRHRRVSAPGEHPTVLTGGLVARWAGQSATRLGRSARLVPVRTVPAALRWAPQALSRPANTDTSEPPTHGLDAAAGVFARAVQDRLEARGRRVHSVADDAAPVPGVRTAEAPVLRTAAEPVSLAVRRPSSTAPAPTAQLPPQPPPWTATRDERPRGLTSELLDRLTEQVVRSIDDRIRAQRERMGG
jgi:hypothetical protein